MVSIRECAHSGLCPFGIVFIWECVHSGLCHSGLCPFRIVSIRDCVHLGLCHLGLCPFGIVPFGIVPFGIAEIRDCGHSGWYLMGFVSIRDGVDSVSCTGSGFTKVGFSWPRISLSRAKLMLEKSVSAFFLRANVPIKGNNSF